MHRVQRQRKAPITGDTLWRNPTTRELKIRYLTNGGHFDTKVVPPGGKVSFPKAWGETTTKKVCKVLVTEAEYQQTLKDRAALYDARARAREEQPAGDDDEEEEEEEEEPEPTEPLGDASQPRVVTDDKGKEGDSERSSGDALEKFALEMAEDRSYEQLQEMARGLDVSAGGKKLDIARRLATKMAE